MQLNAQLARLSKIAVCAAVLLCGSGAVHAQCVSKTASGSGATDDKATFQAWETVLQQVDWEAWSIWMTSSDPPLGKAPGWSVKDYAPSCKAGGLGRQCTVRATLCKP